MAIETPSTPIAGPEFIRWIITEVGVDAYCGPVMCIVVGTVKGGPVSCRGVRLSPSSLGTGKMQEIKGKQLDLFP